MLLHIRRSDDAHTPEIHVVQCDGCEAALRIERDWTKPADQSKAVCPCGCTVTATGQTTGIQTPPLVFDTKPGSYYVSCVDAGHTSLLAGPFPNDHTGALALVERVRELAQALDFRAHWHGFGTCRLPSEYTTPGLLNSRVGLPA